MGAMYGLGLCLTFGICTQQLQHQLLLIHKPRVKYDGRFRKMSESGMQQWLDQWGAPMHSVQSRQIGQPCHNRRKWLK
ncbi:hypothetical protein IWW34DRAFT_837709, partial [Fusarium oxysporum f. sp. albedinis]